MPAAPDQNVETLRNPRERRRATQASFVGTTVEFFDFVLYSTAATLVFPQIFFDGTSPATAIALSYLTLASGYLARPFGALFFGHFGDRYGRKYVLVATMVMMGIVTVSIGLTPPSAAIGAAAPIMLVVARLLQGIAMGGEFGGALLLAYEYAPRDRKGLGAAIAMAGAPTGALTASLIFSQFAKLPEDDFMSWGWRVPFLFSFALILVAIYLRSSIKESPEFESRRQTSFGSHSAPISSLLKHWPQVSFSLLVGVASLTTYVLASTYFVGLGISHGYAQSSIVILVTIGSMLQIVGIPATAALSDRIGRLKVLALGNVLIAATIVPVLILLDAGIFSLYAIGFILGMIIPLAAYGPLGAYLGEQFPVRIRYTGVSFTYQLIALISGFAPVVAVELTAAANGHWYLVAIVLTVLPLLALAALRTTRSSATWFTTPPDGMTPVK